MRRSICYCEPASALAGEVRTWKFVYTTASHLPKGAKLRFDLESRGRPIDGRKIEDPPKCLMTFYGETGCWADGHWYDQCPWAMEGSNNAGYYAFEDGYWRRHNEHDLRRPKQDGPPPEEWCVDGSSSSSEVLQPPTRVR